MEDNYRIEKIVFLDTISAAKAHFKNSMPDREELTGGKCLFIAMNPAVYSFLSQKGLLVHNTLSYFTNSSHEKALEKSKILVDYLRQNFEFSGSIMKIDSAYREAFIFFIRSAIHYCLYNIEVASCAMERHQAKSVFAPLLGGSYVLSAYIEPQEKYFGQIVFRIAKNNLSEFKSCTNSKIANIFQAGKTFSAVIKFMLQYVNFKIWENIALAIKLFDKSRVIIFTTNKFQMDKLSKSVKQECPNEASCPKNIYF